MKNPAKIIEKAIKGMLPKSRLGNLIFKNLYVYAGSDHPHQAAQPLGVERTPGREDDLDPALPGDQPADLGGEHA